MTRPEFYDESYLQLLRGRDGGTPLYRMFADHLRTLPLEKLEILDVGCGRGELLAELLEAGARRVTGLDFSRAAVEVAGESLAARFGMQMRERVIEGSATDPALFAKDRFDLILMMDVVEHLPPAQLAQALKTVRSWLAADGRLFIHTFPTLRLHQAYRLYLKLRGHKEELERLDTAHCNVQTRESLSQALAGAGLLPKRMWLQNDFTLTSSAFQNLPEGIGKRLIGWMTERFLTWRPVVRLADRLGMAEMAQPSIYVECEKT